VSRLRPGAGPLLVLLVAVVYAASPRNGHHFDDFHSIVNNPHLDDPARIPAFFVDPASFSVNPESAMYRPLLMTTFAVERALFGSGAAAGHLVSLLIHAACGLLMLRLLRTLGAGERAATTAALVFAVHPLNSEAVLYLSSRSELLTALGVLLACVAAAGVRREGALLHTGGVLAGQAVGLLSKAVAVVTPGLLLMQEGLSTGWRRSGVRWRLVLSSAALSALYVLIVKGAASRALVDEPVRRPLTQLFTQAKAQSYYLWLTAMPARLNVEHQFDVSRTAEPAVLLSVLLIVSLAGAAWWARRALPAALFAAGWWALVLLPTSVVPLIVLVNEHRLYLALAGLLLPLAVCLLSIRHGRRVAGLLVGAYTILLALLTIDRVPTWRSEATLWADAAAKAPLMLRPHLRLADALDRQGEMAAAEASYLRAVALRPHHVAGRNNLGLLYRRQGRLDDAAGQFEALLAVSPDSEAARLNLADLELQRGDWRRARAHYNTALTHGTTGGRAQARLGQIALRFDGDAATALAAFEAAARAGNDDVDILIGQGIALRALGRDAAAQEAYESALRRAPGRGDIWFNLGNLHAEQGRLAAAADAYRRVLQAADDADLAHRAQERLQRIDKHQIDQQQP
jgi:tetratricopeptide (TPR) repeat protein